MNSSLVIRSSIAILTVSSMNRTSARSSSARGLRFGRLFSASVQIDNPREWNVLIVNPSIFRRFFIRSSSSLCASLPYARTRISSGFASPCFRR